MADKRELLLVIRGKDQGAKKTLDGLADAAEDLQDELGDVHHGLKTLDQQTSDTTRKLEGLRREFARSGDVGLLKDIQKAEAELKKLARQRKLTLGVDIDRDLTRVDARLSELTRRREALIEAKADKKAVAAVDAVMEELTKRRKAFVEVSFDRAGAARARRGLDDLLENAATEVGPGVASRLAAGIAAKLPAFATKFGGAGGAIGAGLAIGAAPVIGANVAAAIIGGAGIGGIVGGIVIAAKHPAVKAEAQSLGEDLGRALERAAEPMVPATIDVLKIIRTKFHEAEDDISGIFDAAAENAPVLAEGAGEGIKSVIHGVRELAQRMDPVINALADGFEDLGRAIEEGLGDLADNANEAARALQITFAVLEAGVTTVFKLVDGLAEAYGWMDQVSSLMRGDPGPLIRNLYEDAYEADRSARDLIETQRGLIGGYHLTAEAANAAAQATRDYADANRTLTDQNLSVAESTLRYKEAIVAARDAVDKKKKVSLEEEGALLSQARASNSLIESLDRQGASAKQLAAQHSAARKELIATAEKMGYTKEEAARLADEYLLVPRNVDTQFTADTDQAARNLRDVRDRIAQIQSKRVVITVVNKQVTIRSEGRNVPIGDLGGRELGGPVRANKAYVVGEKRPEVFVPDRDGTIIPSVEKFRRGNMSLGGGSVDVRLSVVPGMGSELERALMKAIRVEVAGSGSGSVQRAFG